MCAGEKHHKAVQHNGQASDEHNHNEDVDVKSTVNAGGDGHKVAMDNGDANGKEVALIGGGGGGEDDGAGGKDYTVYLR